MKPQLPIRTSLVLEAQFSSAHFYVQPAWSEEKNKNEFGRCYTPYGHGHNYRALAEWEISPTALSSDEILELREKIQKAWYEIISELDHEHLNFVIPEFRNQVPTTENICQHLVEKIKSRIQENLLRLDLYEMDDIGAAWVSTQTEL